MGFAGYPITTDTDWLAKTYVNQLIEAISERHQALGGNAHQLAQALDDACYCNNPFSDGWALIWPPDQTPRVAKVNWRWIMYTLEAMCTSFVNSAPFGHDIANLHGYDGEIENYTLATWRAAAGIHADGYEAMLRDESTIVHRLPEPTDTIRTKMFNQVYQGLKVLKYTKANIGKIELYDGNGDPLEIGGNQYREPTNIDGYPTYADAKANALGECYLHSFYGDADHSPEWSEPTMLPTNQIEVNHIRYDPGDPLTDEFHIGYYAAKFKGMVSSLSTKRSKTVKFLFRIKPPSYHGVQNLWGLWEYGDNKWNLGESISAGTSDVAKMTTFKGSSDYPAWGGVFPGDPGINQDVNTGYECSQSKAVIDWGFSYV